jgi:hypothetical protein
MEHQPIDDSPDRPWDPVGSVVVYTYDASGNLIAQTWEDPAAMSQCPDCFGAGVITLFTSAKVCRRCRGTGKVSG